MDALGRKTLFKYDALGRRIQRQLPGGQSEGFRYDALCKVLAHTNFNELVITNGYDAMNRLKLKATVAGLAVATYAYTASGSLTQRVDEAGTHTWIYDNRGRVRTNPTPVGILYYAYDANGNLTKLQSSTTNGVHLDYAYGPLNRVTGVANHTSQGPSVIRYTFDGVGNLSTLVYLKVCEIRRLSPESLPELQRLLDHQTVETTSPYLRLTNPERTRAMSWLPVNEMFQELILQENRTP